MNHIMNNIEYILAVLIVLVGYVVFTNYGMSGKVRRFVRKNKLKTKKKEDFLAVEFLRQQFLLKYPDQRDKDTEEFLEVAKKFLVYREPDYEYEDGVFYVNKKSPLLIPPPPTKEMPYVPPGWEGL